MWPLSMSEIEQKKSHFLELAFDPTKRFSVHTYWNRKKLVESFSKDGYPDALVLDPIMRDRWYDNLSRTA